MMPLQMDRPIDTWLVTIKMNDCLGTWTGPRYVQHHAVRSAASAIERMLTRRVSILFLLFTCRSLSTSIGWYGVLRSLRCPSPFTTAPT